MIRLIQHKRRICIDVCACGCAFASAMQMRSLSASLLDTFPFAVRISIPKWIQPRKDNAKQPNAKKDKRRKCALDSQLNAPCNGYEYRKIARRQSDIFCGRRRKKRHQIISFVLAAQVGCQARARRSITVKYMAEGKEVKRPICFMALSPADNK